MSWFSLNPKKPKTVAIIDIGSSSVGGALVEYRPKAKNLCPAIAYSTRKEIVFDDNLDFKRFITSLTGALESVITELHQKAKGPIDHYHCSLPSPLFVSQTKNIRYGEDRSFIVTPSLLKDITNKTADTFAESNRHLYPELQNDQSFILESAIMQVRLNGYVIERPEQKKAETMSISHHVSISSQAVRQKLLDTIAKFDRRASAGFHSYTFEIFSTLRDILPETSFIAVDVSGELTDVFLVVNDVLFASASFPLGRNFLIRTIANEMNTVYAEAESALNLHAQNKSSPTNQTLLAAKLSPIRDEWMKHLRQVLEAFQD
ncbi:MAG TPA: hypothetical protein VEB60_01700, partial [Candidatus Paceibacterota bacterium]|nr:hypothetical protein [Candidatus Paceibacterota bacterium]